MGFFSTPFMQVTEAVVPPRGAARQEWRIIDDLSRRIGIAPYSLRPLRMLARLGLRLSPWRLIDGLLRIGPAGDWFGLKPLGPVAREGGPLATRRGPRRPDRNRSPGEPRTSFRSSCERRRRGRAR